MTNEELIKVLRICGNYEDREGCDEECPYFHDDCPRRIMNDAADAIEAAEHRIADLETALAACRIQRGERLPKGNFWEIVS